MTSRERREYEQQPKDEPRVEYALAKLGKRERGKYCKRLQEATNVVVIDPDVMAAFPNSKAVNDALRGVLARRKRKAT